MTSVVTTTSCKSAGSMRLHSSINMLKLHKFIFQSRAVNSRRVAMPMKSRMVITTKASGEDQILRSISDNGQVSVLVVRGNSLVQEATQRHCTAPTAGAALGRALLGSLLMGSFREQGEKTQITFRGDGPLGSIQVIADALGNVKGKVGNPAADPPLRPDGKLNVGAAVGRGVLAVVRSLPFTEKGWQTPYTGMVPIVSGEIAEDLASYLVESEQTQSALGLGVSIGRDLSINAAGGFLIQVLPFAEEETLSLLERNIMEAGSVTSMLMEGMSPRDITERLLRDIGVADQGFSIKPQYGPCEAQELRDRMASAVAALGEAEVQDILREQGKIEVTCE
jgi:molecular chaperone Hsp33